MCTSHLSAIAKLFDVLGDSSEIQTAVDKAKYEFFNSPQSGAKSPYIAIANAMTDISNLQRYLVLDSVATPSKASQRTFCRISGFHDYFGEKEEHERDATRRSLT